MHRLIKFFVREAELALYDDVWYIRAEINDVWDVDYFVIMLDIGLGIYYKIIDEEEKTVPGNLVTFDGGF